MTQQSLKKEPPRGFNRILWRLPIAFYHLGLGGLMGERMLLLEHTGRKSGLKRQAVIEVVRHDESADAYIIASGFGKKSDWYQNLLKTPQAVIQVGRRRLKVRARQLDVNDAENEFQDYARRHPTALRNLASFMGYPIEPGESGPHQLAQLVPVIRLEPEQDA